MNENKISHVGLFKEKELTRVFDFQSFSSIKMKRQCFLVTPVEQANNNVRPLWKLQAPICILLPITTNYHVKFLVHRWHFTGSNFKNLQRGITKSAIFNFINKFLIDGFNLLEFHLLQQPQWSLLTDPEFLFSATDKKENLKF